MKPSTPTAFLVAWAALFAAWGTPAGGVEEETPYKLGGLLVRECDTPAKSLLLQADAYREKGEFRNALAVYQKILRTYPSALYPL
ncbi:MAG: tetratricopeptide repeat protein, partial [Planctomycetota bacterium]